MSEEHQEFRGWHQVLIVIFVVVGVVADVPKTEWWAHEYRDLEKERVSESPSQRALDAVCLCLRSRYTFFSPLELLLICRHSLLQFSPRSKERTWRMTEKKRNQCTMLHVVRRFLSDDESGEDRLILVTATRLNSDSATLFRSCCSTWSFLSSSSLLDPNSVADKEREYCSRMLGEGKDSRTYAMMTQSSADPSHRLFALMFMRPHLLLRDSVWACPLLCVLSFTVTTCDTFCCSCCSPRPNFLPFENVTQYALVDSVSQWAILFTLRFFDFNHSSTLLLSTEFWALTTRECREAKENTEENEGGEGFVSALPDPAHNSMVVF